MLDWVEAGERTGNQQIKLRSRNTPEAGPAFSFCLAKPSSTAMLRRDFVGIDLGRAPAPNGAPGTSVSFPHALAR